MIYQFVLYKTRKHFEWYAYYLWEDAVTAWLYLIERYGLKRVSLIQSEIEGNVNFQMGQSNSELSFM